MCAIERIGFFLKSQYWKIVFWKRKSGQESALQILPQSFDLLNQEVNVRLGSCRIRNNHSEEVGFVSLRLVSNHCGT